MNVLIADDEKIVLEGLKYIIDWNRLGFTICQTACDGQDAFEKNQKSESGSCPSGYPDA